MQTLFEPSAVGEVKKHYFSALTGLRAVAAGLVFVHHFNPFGPERFGWRIHKLAAETHVGVTIFFVLSGFLIGYQYLERQVVLRTYFAKRIARIYPMYFLLTTFTFAVLYFQGKPFYFGDYVLNITFLRGLFKDYVYTGIGQGWSLTVEEMFYLSVPTALWFIRRNGHWLWGIPLALTGLGIGMVLLCQLHPWHGFFGSFNFLFRFTYMGRAVEFFTGMGLAWWLRRPGLNSTPRGITYWGVVCTLLCIGALSLLHGPKIGRLGVLQPPGLVINNLFLPLLGVGPLLWGLVGEQTWLSRFLSTRLMVLLGKSSYVFYLIHIGVIHDLLYHALRSDVMTLLGLYGLSGLLYWAVEEPLNHLLRRVLAKSTPLAPV